VNRYELTFSILRIPFDFLALVLAALLAYFIRPMSDLIPFTQIPFPTEFLMPFSQFLEFSIISAFIFIIISSFNGLYSFVNTQGRFWELFQIIFSVFFLVLAIVAFYALFKTETFFSRGVLLLMATFTVILSYLFRMFLRSIERIFLGQGKGVRRVALWGNEKLRKQLVKEVEKSLHYKIIYHAKDFDETKINPKDFDEVWFVKTEGEDGRDLLEFAQVNHLLYRFVPDVFGTLHSKVEEGTIGSFPLLAVKATPLEAWGRVVKRSFDILASSVGLLILSPLFLVFAILIKLDSKGPVFYVSERVGRNGNLFKMFKFRSMIVNAEELKERLVKQSHRQDSPLFKIKNDPRITKLGKFLRRFSIDELPQLFNVFIGNMSLVGPRPHLANEVDKYSLDQKRVLMIKPGITGLSQVSGRSDLAFEEEVRLDLHYIVQWSLLLDFKIIWKTPWVLLKGDGAD
jgi:exopolysaccharide biosynthesis polyprenyl glycosylphosphotransferase